MTKWCGVLTVGMALVTAWACSPRTTVVAPAVTSSQDAGSPEASLFEEVPGATSGLDFTYRNGEDVPHLAILESLGGGVGLIDYDGDGLLDVFVPGGGFYDGPDKKLIKGQPCKLFKNLGGWKFKDVTAEVGLDQLAGGAPWFYSHGCAVADFDRDGWPDLLVTGWGRIALFRNVPDGKSGRRFSDVSGSAGLDRGITWATSAAWADFDGDGFPDLYVCQYVDWSFRNHPTDCKYDSKTLDVCPPKRFKGLQHRVFRNTGQDGFVDVTAEAGLLPGGEGRSKGLGVVAVDVNLDGKPDIYVANDTVDNFLYVNASTPGKIRFTEQGLLAGVARDGNGAANGSMGVDAGDPGGTGLPWLWVTNYENELHALYGNMSKGGHVNFLFRTPVSGIGAIGQKFVGWGTGFIDLDNHGWEDLFIANGHAIRFPTGTTRPQFPVLMRNVEGKFKDISKRGGAYFQKMHLARGIALGDLDNDGKVDVVVNHTNEPVALLRNVSSPDNHWIGIQLAGKDHADTVGTRVVVEAGGRKQTRFSKGGCSYASSPDRRFVVGLGSNTRIDKLIVTWPNGKTQEWKDLSPNRYYKFTEGQQEFKSLR